MQSVCQITGTLPPDIYSVSVRVVKATGEQTEMAQLHYTHQIFEIGALHLISPADDEMLQALSPILLWNCTLQGALNYTVYCAPVMGEQSAFDALRSNPLLFTQTNVLPSLLQYPIDAKPLQPCSKYAWQVRAYNGKYQVGESEAWLMLTPCRQLDGTALTLTENDKGSFGEGNRPAPLKQEKLYYGLQHNLEGGYYKVSDTLRLSFPNNFATTSTLKSTDLRLKLVGYNPKTGNLGENMLNDTHLDQSFRVGDNRLSMPLLSLNLQPQAFYILEIRNATNQPYYLKFQYIGGTNRAPDWKQAIDKEH